MLSSLPGPRSEGRPVFVGNDALTSTSGGIFAGSSQSVGTVLQSTDTRLRMAWRYPSTRGKVMTEGMSIRAISRVTDIHKTTILSLLKTVGDKCARLFDAKVAPGAGNRGLFGLLSAVVNINWRYVYAGVPEKKDW